MVSKCANPDCSASFRYFHKGKLFRVETASGFERRRTMGKDGERDKLLRRLEFYWLCEDCAGKMTLIFDKGSGIIVRATDSALAATAA